MPARVLTLKYRPQTFDQILIQNHVTETLKKAIEHDRLANAYLFAGPRGVGKTTTARILAKSLNCEKGPTTTPCNKCTFCVEITASRSMDVLEIDGASNRGIDQIRELRENIKYAPSAARYKVYIIDEVHMLTEPAFNALLKTLEEPPRHAKFIFATTHAHDVPATIISRCQRFDFRKASPREIKERLAWLAGQEKIKASDAALAAIARRAEGAIRDAESILDQVAAYRPEGIEAADVEELLGVVPAELFHDYAQLVLQGDARGLLEFLDRLFEAGHDHIEFYSGLVEHFRDLLLVESGGPVQNMGLMPEEAARMAEQGRSFGRARLLKALGTLSQSEVQARATQHPRVLLEVLSLELAGNHASRNPQPGTSDTPVAHDRPTALAEVWSELRLKLNAHKPMLASALDLAAPVSYADGTLAISFPTKHKAAAERIEAAKHAVEQALTEAAGRPSQIRIAVTRKAESDAVRDRITRVLGDVEEES